MKYGLYIFLLASCCLHTAHAAYLELDTDGVLIGATGVQVNGAIYDVSFHDGLLWDQDKTKSSIFRANISDIGDLNDAISASKALISQVWSVELNYNTLEKATNGCWGDNLCQVITPYAYDESINKLSYAYANNYSASIEDTTGNSFILGSGSFDTRNYGSYTIALWRLSSISPIPEPSPQSLAIIGGAFLIRLRGRNQRC